MFLIAIIAFISSCCPANDVPKAIRIGEEPVRAFVRPYHFEYNGHQYIYFLGSAGHIVHNPDCSCNKESSNTLW
jgi:hypothetical protein